MVYAPANSHLASLRDYDQTPPILRGDLCTAVEVGHEKILERKMLKYNLEL